MQFELMLTVALVVMVIFLFLRTLPATVIPSVAVPLVAGRHLRRHVPARLQPQQPDADGADHLDRLRRRRRHRDDREHRALHRGGRAAAEAALKGSEQIGFTIVSLTVSLIAVLIPLLFMGDIVGRLFREFAVTLSVTILVSAVVSLTLTPMMCAKLLRHTPESEQGRFYRASERALRAGHRVLRPDACAGCCGHQTATLLVAVGTLVLDRAALHRRSQGLLSRCRTPASSSASPRRRSRSRSRRWPSGSRRWPA